jgi:hypothetical protein
MNQAGAVKSDAGFSFGCAGRCLRLKNSGAEWSLRQEMMVFLCSFRGLIATSACKDGRIVIEALPETAHPNRFGTPDLAHLSR